MGLEARATTLMGYRRDHPMGLIADRLKTQLAEMAARHTEADREIAQLKREADQLRATVDATYADLVAELAD